MVRFFLALLAGFATVGALSSSAEDVLPPRFNFDRYTRMLDQSPFAIATAPALPEATPDFSRDLYIANAARTPEGEMVTIRSSSDQNFKKYMTTKEPVDGYSIASIEWSDRVGATKVTISKDGKFATLTFNQALLSQAAPQGLPRAGQMRPSVPSIALPAAGQASRNDVHAVIQRDPKVAGASTLDPMPGPVPNLEPPQVNNPQQQQQRAHADRKRKEESYQR